MKRRGCWIAAGGILAGLVFLLGGAYVVMDREDKTLDTQTRAALPGQFVPLTDGFTHYELSGPETGQVVVLVHGFSVASYSWERTVPALVDAGFRVLTYDLYGRGYSDRPDGPYDLDLFVRQLDELLTALNIDRPVDIAGISLGGYVTGGFVHQHPDRVRRVVLLAPQSEAMGSDERLSFVTLPGIGDYAFTVYIVPFVMVDSEDEFKDYMPESDWHDRYLDMMQYAGFRHALLATLRDMPGDPFDEYRAVGKLDKPVLLLWGDLDHTVPIANSEQVLAAIPQAEFHIIPGARHASIYERPEVVNPLLVAFLSR